MLVWLCLFGIVFYLLVLKYWTFFSDRGVRFVRGLPLLGSNYNVTLGRESLVGPSVACTIAIRTSH